MSDFTGIRRIDRLLADAEETPNPTGNPTRKIFFHADRYLFDFNIDVGEWEQFDTENDAWYFGVWVNKTRLRILQYVEGDVYFTQCADAEAYDAEIAALCAFYEAALRWSSSTMAAKRPPTTRIGGASSTIRRARPSRRSPSPHPTRKENDDGPAQYLRNELRPLGETARMPTGGGPSRTVLPVPAATTRTASASSTSSSPCGSATSRSRATGRSTATTDQEVITMERSRRRNDDNPARIYLASIGQGSQWGMRQALEAIAQFLSDDRHNAESFPWWEVRYRDSAAVRTFLAKRYKPSTVNKMLSALRGVLKQSWRLGYMDADTYQRAADVENLQGSTVPRGRALAGGEVALLPWAPVPGVS